MCRSKASISSVQEQSEDELSVFLEAVHSQPEASKPWNVILQMNGCRVEFKIDSEADVTVLPTELYQPNRDGALLKPKKLLKGPSQITLSVRGCFTASLEKDDLKSEEQIYVVEGLSKPLVGKAAIISLKLLSTLKALSVEESIPDQYLELFKGLGRLSGRYTIRLKDRVTPFALSTPRRVAVPLLPKVREELDRMERIAVILKVHEPTDWWSGMVVVPKPNGRIRICVDLTKLNRSVCRERHILPSVEDTLACLAGAQWFSKLDANSGFWQVELDPKSALLTTFITSFGRYCFNRLPFRITSAPEHFQRKISDILSGLVRVVTMMDDILVYGKTKEEPDKNLKRVVQVLKLHNVTLNK